MKNFRKGLLLTALLSISFTVYAQNNDSTSIGAGGGFNNSINSQSSNANNAVIAPMYCQNRVMTWTVNGNTCSGTATQTNEGANRTVISNGTNTGSASYTCSNNNYINPRSLSCVAPTPTCDSSNWQPSMNQFINPCIFSSPPPAPPPAQPCYIYHMHGCSPYTGSRF